jgi:hypothetical protein
MVESSSYKVLLSVGDEKEVDFLDVNPETMQMLKDDSRFVSFQIKHAEEDKDDLVA